MVRRSRMIHKVSYIAEDAFQVDNETVPLDEQSLVQLAQELGGWDEGRARGWVEQVKLKKVGELETEANKGVVVDLYEVDYPAPADPMKETEQLASHLDEHRDFITQYLFPGSDSQDIVVGTETEIEKRHKSKVTPTAGWRGVLSWRVGADGVAPLTRLEKMQIQRSRRIDYKKLEQTYGMSLFNWIDVEFGAGHIPRRAVIGYDVFRYLVAIETNGEEDVCVENYSVDYTDLVEENVNPYDLAAVVEYAIQMGPEDVSEGKDLDTLLEDEEFTQLRL